MDNSNPTRNFLNKQSLAYMFSEIAAVVFPPVSTSLKKERFNSWVENARIDSLFNRAAGVWDREGRMIMPELLRHLLIEEKIDQEDQKLKEQGISIQGQYSSIKDIIRAVEDSIPSFDRLSGFLSKQHVRLITGFAHAYATKMDVPTAHFSWDMTNMKGTNEHFRKLLATSNITAIQEVSEDSANALTDMAAKILTDIIQKNLLDYKKSHSDVVVLPMREGGDEFGAIVTNINQDQADTLNKKILQESEEAMAKLGLLRHEHAKHRGDPMWSGFGMGGCCFDLRSIDPASYNKNIEKSIEQNKEALFLLRRDSEYLQALEGLHGQTLVYPLSDPNCVEEDSGLENYPGNMPYQDIYDSEAKKALRNFDTAAKSIQAELEYIISQNTQDVEDSPYPFENEQVETPLFVPPATEKQIKLVHYLKETAGIEVFSKPLEQIVRLITKDLAPKCPATGSHMDTELPAVIAKYADDHEKITAAGDDLSARPAVIAIEIQNLSTLNKYFGHDGSDRFLEIVGQEVIRGSVEKFLGEGVLHQVMGDWSVETKPYYDVHAGGGRFFVVLPSVVNNNGETVNVDGHLRNQIIGEMKQRLTQVEQDCEISKKLDMSTAFSKLADLMNLRGKKNVTGIAPIVVQHPYSRQSFPEVNGQLGGKILGEVNRKLADCVYEMEQYSRINTYSAPTP